MPSLTIIAGPNAGNYYPLGKGTVVIGRDEACPVQIVDVKASRKHVQIRLDDQGQHIALDMKSANGTRINGRPIAAETPLLDGDEIAIGNSTICYSTQDFQDRESALSHFKQRGQKAKQTLQQ